MTPNAERNAAMIAQVDRGLSFGQVAKSFGVSRSSVAGAVWRAKQPKNPRVARVARVARVGEASANHKLTDAKVRAILERRRCGARLIDLARDYGVDISSVSRICARKSWAHVQ